MLGILKCLGNALWKISSIRCSRFVVDLTMTASLEKCCAAVMRRLRIPFLYSAMIQIYNSRQVMQMELCKLWGGSAASSEERLRAYKQHML